VTLSVDMAFSSKCRGAEPLPSHLPEGPRPAGDSLLFDRLNQSVRVMKKHDKSANLKGHSTTIHENSRRLRRLTQVCRFWIALGDRELAGMTCWPPVD
jgi:hypothetical protein